MKVSISTEAMNCLFSEGRYLSKGLACTLLHASEAEAEHGIF